MRLSLRDIGMIAIGGFLLLLGYDYYVVRARALNGQKTFEYMTRLVANKHLPPNPETPPPSSTPTPGPTAVLAPDQTK